MRQRPRWASSPWSPAQAAHAKQEFPFRHIVIIYEENHSFDNLYGLWDQVEGQSVNGLAMPIPRTPPRCARTTRRPMAASTSST